MWKLDGNSPELRRNPRCQKQHRHQNRRTNRRQTSQNHRHRSRLLSPKQNPERNSLKATGRSADSRSVPSRSAVRERKLTSVLAHALKCKQVSTILLSNKVCDREDTITRMRDARATLSAGSSAQRAWSAGVILLARFCAR